MTEPLSALERRVLGVLVEKALTAAAPEPLTLNAVVVGSNQKSNRDPVMSVEEPEADEALERLQLKGLVFRITGGRAERWRHNLYEACKVTKPELALLAELLLRGPQTAAEARSRASRMEPLDHELATSLMKSLAERGLLVWLAPENRRGATLTHGFHPPDELGRSPAPPAAAAERVRPLEERLGEVMAEIARLRAEVGELRATVKGLQEALGIQSSG
jgi:uncharacterized protein YceH (UPF0502 family)